jgi:hypothetical protein
LDPKVFLLLDLALAFSNVGTIWAHEMDIFRSWKLLDPSNFHAVQRLHWRKLPYWVLLPVGLSLLGSIVLIWYHPGNSPLWSVAGAFFSSMAIAGPAFVGDHGSRERISIRLHHSLQWSLRATAKQSGAAERSLGRDCFVAQSAPRNDSANLIGICSNPKKLS